MPGDDVYAVRIYLIDGVQLAAMSETGALSDDPRASHTIDALAIRMIFVTRSAMLSDRMTLQSGHTV